jgi:ribonuclease HI
MKISKVRIYSDGASRGNPGHAAFGYAIFDGNDNLLRKDRGCIGIQTNNVAEFTAPIKALAAAVQFGPEEVECFCDSNLLANHETWKIKKPHLRELILKLNEKKSLFGKVTFSRLPREHPKIQMADKLANEALDNDF